MGGHHRLDCDGSRHVGLFVFAFTEDIGGKHFFGAGVNGSVEALSEAA